MDIDSFFALQRGRVQQDSRVERDVARKRFARAKGDPTSLDPPEIYAQWQKMRGNFARGYNPVYSWYKRLGILYDS